MEGRVRGFDVEKDSSSLLYLLSFVILLTSMVDLFVNRLLFRAGPEVLSHMNFDPTDFAVIGAISLNIEQLALFLVVGFFSFALIRYGRRVDRFVGLLLVPLLLCSALLYLPVPDSLAWAASVMIVGVAAVVVTGLTVTKAVLASAEGGLSRVITIAFMVMLTLGFLMPLYYRLGLLTGAAGLGNLPLSLSAYEVGISAVWGTSVAAFIYAIAAPSGQHPTRLRTVIKAAIIPTLIVGPILYGILNSFFMTQIFSLVIAMSTDFALSLYFVQVLTVAWWFLLTAAFLLIIKGRGSSKRELIEEGIGLLLLMSTTFLFNYPYYMMLGIVGVLLITRHIGRDTPQ